MTPTTHPRARWRQRVALWAGATAAAGAAVLLCIGGVALAVIYPQLPDVSALADYRPKLPLRVYTAEGVLIGEFGEERRNFTPIAQILRSGPLLGSPPSHTPVRPGMRPA